MRTLTLPRRATAPAWARRYLEPRLRELGFPEDTVYEILVATSEAVTNAVLHGGPGDPCHPDELTVTLSVEGSSLTIAVTSPRTGWLASPAALPDPTVESGRGFFVIQSFTDAWRITQGPEGSTVYLIRRLPDAKKPPAGRSGTLPAHPRARPPAHRPQGG